MRVLSALMARKARTEPVPFDEILPLKLKPRVSGKGVKSSEVCCIHEMSVMFSCLKNNEFTQSVCSKEIDAFQKCYKSHLDMKKSLKDREAKGILVPGEKNLSAKQVNALLKMYPTFE